MRTHPLARANKASQTPAARPPAVSRPAIEIGSTTDPAEHEADRLAREPMRASPGIRPSGGRPLDAETRDVMEGSFGHGFGDVRVHADSRAADAARLLDAEAYTVGTDIAFAAGRYEPASSVGRRLLAHELAHVVQQRGNAGAAQAPTLVDGNRRHEEAADAAADAVAAGRSAPLQPRAPVGIACQRTHSGPATEEQDPTKLTQSDLVFKRLPPGRGWLTGTGRNTMAQQLHDEFEHVFDVSRVAESAMGFLYWTEDTLGPRSLAAVEAIAPAVAAKSRGDAGEKMRNAVDAYTQAFPELESALTELKGAEAEIVAKSEAFLRAVTEQKKTAAKRAEKKAEGDVKEVQEKIEKAKKWVDEIIDGTFKVFTGDWKEALQDIGKFALKEVIAGPVVESFYQADLEKAQARLTEARALVDSLEDESDLHAVTGAAKELEAAKDRFSSKTEHLLVVVRRANSAHRTLIEKLSGLGRAGARAAAALESREEVAERAKDAVEVLGTYEQLVGKARKDAHSLMLSYQLYAEFARSPGGKNEVQDDDLRGELAEIADSNEWTAKHLENWCEDEIGRIAKARRYVESGTYMEPYRRIDQTLASAVANR